MAIKRYLNLVHGTLLCRYARKVNQTIKFLDDVYVSKRYVYDITH